MMTSAMVGAAMLIKNVINLAVSCNLLTLSEIIIYMISSPSPFVKVAAQRRCTRVRGSATALHPCSRQRNGAAPVFTFSLSTIEKYPLLIS